MSRLISIRISIFIKVSGGDFGGADGTDRYTMIRDGSSTTVCQDGTPECIPDGETTTETIVGEATDGTTGPCLIMMFGPTGKAGTTQAVINSIGVLPAAIIMEQKTVGTSGVLNRKPNTARAHPYLARVPWGQEINKLQWLLETLT